MNRGIAIALGVLCAIGFPLGLYMVFHVAPMQDQLYFNQKIFYFHVPSAYAMYIGFAVSAVGSALYLIKRDPKWDAVGVAGAEVGSLFCLIVLLTGPLWARKAWGVWWTWDPRLTTTAIMLMIYVGYLVVRSFAEDPEKRARWSAIIGIVGFVDVPIVYLSVLWWRTLHQPPSSPRSMAGEFVYVLLLNVAAFTFLFIYLMMRRYRLAVAERHVEELRVTRDDGRIG